MALVAFALRLGLGLVFLAGGLAKRRRSAEFETAVRQYRILPVHWTRPVARALPLLEVACGVALIAGIATRFAFIVATSLLVAFAGAIAVNLLRGREIDCGCLGITAERVIGWPMVLRNFVLSAGALVAVVAGDYPRTFDSLLGGGSSSVATGTCVAVTIATLTLLVLVRLIEETVSARTVARELLGKRF